MSRDTTDTVRRRRFLGTVGAVLGGSGLAGCSGDGDNGGDSENEDGGDTPTGESDTPTETDALAVSDFIEHEHRFLDRAPDEEVASISYELTAENITDSKIFVGSEIQTFSDNIRLDSVVNAIGDLSSGIRASDSRGISVESPENVTRYTINIEIAETDPLSTLAEETFEYSGEDFRSRLEVEPY